MKNKHNQKRLLAFIMAVSMLAGSVSLSGADGGAEAVYAANGIEYSIVPETSSEEISSQETQTTDTSQPTEEATTTEATTTETATTTEDLYIAETVHNLSINRDSGTTAKLTWSVSRASASGFYIFRQSSAGAAYEKIATVPATAGSYIYSYTDKKLLCGFTYTYKVQPYHVLADQSVVTDLDSTTVTTTKSIATPTIKSAKRSGKKITLTWSKVIGISGYKVYRLKNGSYKQIKTVNANKTSVTLSGYSKNKEYSFKIAAYVTLGKKTLTGSKSSVYTIVSEDVLTIQKQFQKLKKQYPSYTYWNHMGSSSNNASSYTTTPCQHDLFGLYFCNYYQCPTGYLGLQCYGFAWMLSDRIYGKNTKYKKHTSFSKAAVGDVIRYNKHSVIITEKHKNYIKVAECNIGGHCMIYWGRKVYKSELKGARYFHRELS